MARSDHSIRKIKLLPSGMFMEDALNLASAKGFVLGMLAAEELHTTPLDSKTDNEAALFELILAIADGTKSLVPDHVLLLKLDSSCADGAWARETMQETALRLVEWYRRKLFT
jgi:hypothetical protein